MKITLAYIASHFLPSTKDVEFNSWCSEVGILCPSAEVRTTPRSVAGRGVFTTEDVSEGDVLVSVPYYSALTQETGRKYFPDVAEKLERLRKKTQSPLRRAWNRIRRKQSAEILNDDNFWRAELTAYALEALETNHPWSPWISQWLREDPFQQLIEEGFWRFDDYEAIGRTLEGFGEMAPDISKHKVNAAIGIRLAELENYTNSYKDNAPFSESIYTTMTSRAIGIEEGVTACLPMHDMINHSLDPNIAMNFNDDGYFEFFALRDLAKDSELFLSYMDVTDERGEWDEDKATWMLVQWGIPTSPKEINSITAEVDKEPPLQDKSAYA